MFTLSSLKFPLLRILSVSVSLSLSTRVIKRNLTPPPRSFWPVNYTHSWAGLY